MDLCHSWRGRRRQSGNLQVLDALRIATTV
jgi:hypothetical protein